MSQLDPVDNKVKAEYCSPIIVFALSSIVSPLCGRIVISPVPMFLILYCFPETVDVAGNVSVIVPLARINESVVRILLFVFIVLRSEVTSILIGENWPLVVSTHCDELESV